MADNIFRYSKCFSLCLLLPQRLPREAFTVPGITVVDHRIKIVQTVRLTKIIQKSQDNNSAVTKVYQPEEASKVAWGETSL